MILNFSTLDEAQKYKTMSNTIFPRPIAWITSEDENIVNLAPFSYFTPLSSEPPLIIVSIGHKENGEPKDTLANIIKNGVCTINFAHKELLQDLKNSAEPLAKNESECEIFNIKTKKILEDFPPMVADAQCALFCKFVKTVEVGSRFLPTILEIQQVYLTDEHIDLTGHIHLENIGRVGTEYLVDSIRTK